MLGHARRRLTSFSAPPVAQQEQSPFSVAAPGRRFASTLRIALITALVALLVIVSAAAVVALRRQDVYPGVRAGEANLGGSDRDTAAALIASEAARWEGQALTLSIGVTELGSSDRGTAMWLARADAALYMAKTTGRNRIVAA